MQECSLKINSAHIFPLSYDLQYAWHQIAIKQNVSGTMQAPKPMTGRKMKGTKELALQRSHQATGMRRGEEAMTASPTQYHGDTRSQSGPDTAQQ